VVVSPIDHSVKGQRTVHFKVIIAIVEDTLTDIVLDAARRAGATGATILDQARGEGIRPAATFFGLAMTSQRDVLLLLVEEHMSRRILERIAEVGRFDERPGLGIAFQIDVEDAVGVGGQALELRQSVESEI
jgi:nitrogen regulatory protein PII